MQPADSDPLGAQPFGPQPKVALVPIYIELHNTKNLPIRLFDGEVRGERDKGGQPCAGLEWREGAIPRHGTVRLVTYVPLENLQRLESESLHVFYKTFSETQGTAYDLSWWLRRELYNRFHIDIDPLNISMDKSVTPLLKDQAPAHLPQPYSSLRTTSSP
jgi:hypothetical protein